MKNISALHSVYFIFQLDRISQLLSFLYRNLRTTKNWVDMVLLRFGRKRAVRAVFRNGQIIEKVTMDNYSGYRNVQESLLLKLEKKGDVFHIPFQGRKILLKGREVPILAAEIFHNRIYGLSNPKGKVVVDVGANIGDSAVYFAARGASRVIALEPFPAMCRTARENIKMNGLRQIELVQSAVGPKSGTMRIDPNMASFSGSTISNHSEGDEVPVLSLEEIISQYGISDAVLKMDCEGCEYEILLNSPNEILSKFNQIILEYHYGYLDLKKKLESAGFSVKVVGFPFRTHNAHAKNPNMVVGFLFAKKLSR